MRDVRAIAQANVYAAISAEDKRVLGRKVGGYLAKRYGRSRYYSRVEIYDALCALKYPPTVHCWAYCLYMRREDFENFHRSQGETCDYESMQVEMIQALGELARQLDPMFERDAAIDTSSWFEDDAEVDAD